MFFVFWVVGCWKVCEGVWCRVTPFLEDCISDVFWVFVSGSHSEGPTKFTQPEPCLLWRQFSYILSNYVVESTHFSE